MRKLYHFIRKFNRHRIKKLIPESCIFILLSLIVSHIMVVKGEPYSQWEMLKMGNYYIALGGSFLIAMTLLLFIRKINIILDERHPWEKGVWFRLKLQVIFGVALIWGLAYALAYGYFSIKGIDMWDTDYWHHDSLTIFEFIIIVNSGYFFRFAHVFLSPSKSRRSKQQKVHEVQTLDTPLWRKRNLSPHKIVLYLFVDKHVFSVSREGEKIMLDQSLIKIFGNLDQEQFFRVNKQTIVHYSLILSVDKLSPPSRILMLTLDSAVCETTTVSQERLPTFKRWSREHGIMIKKV